jgi:F-type H+-transporting ATPase subunit gamma
MANVLDIRRRIRSVRNTRQITKAMKMISAARLRKAQERALAARPYAQMLTNVLRSLVTRADVYDPITGEALHPLLIRRPEKNVLLVVVTGDKGLAGAFNANILKAATRFLRANEGKNVDIEAVGRKGRDFFRRRFPYNEDQLLRLGPVQVVGERVNFLTKLTFSDAGQLAEKIIERYTTNHVDAVYIVYNEFRSVVSQRLVVEQVLPVGEVGRRDVALAREMTAEERERAARAAETGGVSAHEADTSAIDAHASEIGRAPVDYIYEQQPAELFRALLPKYVGTQIYRAMLESVAAEHAARMTAMDSATNNASDMIDSLTLSMNRARQAAITKEIIEIVSGAAAL